MNLILLAVAPIILIIIYIYIKDKFEKEPWRLLAKNFILGATLSVFLTFILHLLLSSVLPEMSENKLSHTFVRAFILVALVEEFSKFIVVKKFAQNHQEFNEPFDGIVYSVMVSMGFAALENVLYVFSYGYSVGFLRAFTAVPAHATFAILMGYFMGKAKFSKNKNLLNLLGLSIATLFHGAYDFFLFIKNIPGIAIGAFVSLLIGILLSRKIIRRHQASEIKN